MVNNMGCYQLWEKKKREVKYAILKNSEDLNNWQLHVSIVLYKEKLFTCMLTAWKS